MLIIYVWLFGKKIKILLNFSLLLTNNLVFFANNIIGLPSANDYGNPTAQKC